MSASDAQTFYYEAVTKYPITAKDTCAVTENNYNSLQDEINGLIEQKATYRSSDKKVFWIDDKISGYTTRRDELKKRFNTMDCQEQQKAADIEQTLEYNTNLLEKTSALAGKTSKTAQYVLLAMVGLVVVVAGVVFIKKIRK